MRVQQKVESILTASQRKNAPQRIESTVRFIGQQIASTRRKFTKSENRVMRNEEEIVEIERKENCA